MNKEQEGLIELVGQEYTKWFYDNAVPSVSGKPILNGEGILTRGEFINKCKTDSEFSEKWGLKIEERELTDVERYTIARQYGLCPKYSNIRLENCTEEEHYNKFNVPTKLITITYNDKTIESYE
jgi:hypothetical protein